MNANDIPNFYSESAANYLVLGIKNLSESTFSATFRFSFHQIVLEFVIIS